MKSWENSPHASKSTSQVWCCGINTTADPMRATYTSLPSNRNSFGNRTAWLLPDRKIFAVLIKMIYTNSRYHSRVFLIRRDGESRIPEMVDLLEGYGDKTLTKDYLNCGQPEEMRRTEFKSQRSQEFRWPADGRTRRRASGVRW